MRYRRNTLRILDIDMKKRNAFELNVEMMPEADALFLSGYDKEFGLVCGEPYDTKTGTRWYMMMISTLEEAVECKYPKVFDENDDALLAALESV